MSARAVCRRGSWVALFARVACRRCSRVLVRGVLLLFDSNSVAEGWQGLMPNGSVAKTLTTTVLDEICTTKLLTTTVPSRVA